MFKGLTRRGQLVQTTGRGLKREQSLRSEAREVEDERV